MTDTYITISLLSPDNEALTEKLTYVNPNALNADLVQFAKDYVGLTENTYVGCSKTVTTKLD